MSGAENAKRNANSTVSICEMGLKSVITVSIVIVAMMFGNIACDMHLSGTKLQEGKK